MSAEPPRGGGDDMAGLRLAWGRPAYVTDEGEDPEVDLWLRNDGGELWSHDGPFDVLVSVIDPETGADLRASEWTSHSPRWAEYVVPPGGAVRVPASQRFPFTTHLPPGRHLLVATLHEHDLRSGPAVLEVLPAHQGSRRWRRQPAPVRRGTPVRLVEDGPSEWARRCLARELGVEVENNDDGTEIFPCALRIGPEEAPERMIAVAGAFHPAWAHTENSGPGIDAVPLPELAGIWLVEVSPGADIDDVAVAVPRLLRQASEQGRLGPAGAGVAAARRIRDEGPGWAHLLPSGPDAPDDDPPDIAGWVGDFLRDPARAGVLEALRRNPAQHREVFIGVTLTAAPRSVASTLAGVGGNAPEVPTEPPDLPSPVTAVWVASLLPFAEPVGLRSNGSRWTTFVAWGEGIDDTEPPRTW